MIGLLENIQKNAFVLENNIGVGSQISDLSIVNVGS